MSRIAADEETALLNPSVDSIREPITLTWQNIRYNIEVKSGVPLTSSRKIEQKEILKDVSGFAQPGQTLAILGSTGAGKSSLLDILAGRDKKGSLSGNILVNGRRPSKLYNRIAGYVTQDDCLMGTQTVRETLTFYANMKLPSTYSEKKKKEKVDQVLLELGLTKVADSLIGSQFQRGISGGEKKRVSIGCELITNPSLLFCDEPTTGLDAYNAMNVMENLSRLAKKNGYTVVCTIHQPRATIFDMFDQLMIMSQGQVVYFGPAKDALQYYTALGYTCRPYENPADYFMDVIVENERHAAKILGDETRGAKSYETSKQTKEEKSDMREIWKHSTQQQDLMEEIRNVVADASGVKETTSASYAQNFFWQLWYLSIRTFSNFIRSPMTTYVQLFQAVFMALLVGSIYFKLDDNPATNDAEVSAAFQDRLGALFFIITNQAFSSFSSLNLFLLERDIFNRERASGTYSTNAYFLAKSLVEMPLLLIFPAVFSCIAYWMVGFQPDLTHFGIFLGTLEVYIITTSSCFVMIGALAPNLQIASIIAPITTVLFLLFGGFYVNNNSIPDYYVWIKYISYFKYGYQILAYNELSNLEFPECTGVCMTGAQQLGYLGMDEVSIVQNIGILLGLAVAFRAIALLFTHLLYRNKN